MTKRLSAGVLLFATAMLALAVTASAEHPPPREWVDKSDPYRDLPVFFRAAAGTTWIQVNDNGGCDAGLITGGGDLHSIGGVAQHTVNEVWCFEAPDSLWPAGPGANATKHDTWNHFSRNLPPVPQAGRWHVTNYENQPIGVGGFWNAWVGCDSLGLNPACDVSFWVNQVGYGTEWEEVLTLNMPNLGNGSGGTLQFDLRYDVECIYDYLYLEYLDTSGNWELMRDGLGGSGIPAVFNGVSGNDTTTAAVAGTACDNGANGDSSSTDGNYFNTDNKANGSPFHGNSTWYTNVQFPIPTVANLSVRWRGSTDPGWSDEDGAGDTDGVGAIDNVVVTWNNGVTVTDGFEGFPAGVGGFLAVTTPDQGANNAVWSTGAAANTYDGWHLSFDPMYTNKGNTCTFSNDWMWAAKPDMGTIPENQFEFLLVSPAVSTVGWTGGTCFYSSYGCMEPDKNDSWNEHVRIYDTGKGGWGPWQTYGAWFGGCDFWNALNGVDLSQYLGVGIDSLQMGWEVIDRSKPGEFAWADHGAVQLLLDNVAIGSFDGGATQFAAGTTGRFTDTFSRADPAHTAFLANPDQGKWPGLSTGGTRQFVEFDSLSIAVVDPDGFATSLEATPPGVGTAKVELFWRANSGPLTAFPGTFQGPKAMDLAIPDANRGPGEGTYRAIIGADDNGSEDYDQVSESSPGVFDGAGFIWLEGQSVEYYVIATDDSSNTAYWPTNADPSDPDFPAYWQFSVLPLNVSTLGNVADSSDANGKPIDTAGGDFILLVDDYLRTTGADIDFENSTGFVADGGIGLGTFTGAVFEDPEDQIERALGVIFPGGSSDVPYWDKYDVLGAGSLIQTEPRGVSDVGIGLGSYMLDGGTNVRYDAIIWLNGTFDALAFEDTTRLELRAYLDNGGCLLSTGDEVAFDLGSGGNDSDSTIFFGINYFGIDMADPLLTNTVDRTLSVQGAAGGPLDGMYFGLYGECPGRRNFDRLTLASPSVGTVSVLATYEGSSSGLDNGVPCATLTTQPGGGAAAHFGFGLEMLLSDINTAQVIAGVLGPNGHGLASVTVPNGPNSGTSSPVIANGFGFNLAQASPNPFSEATSIQFSVPTKTHVRIEVFNILGQRVRTLVNENMEANSYVRDWDGRSDSGGQVSSGIYFYKMVAGDFSATKKTVLLK